MRVFARQDRQVIAATVKREFQGFMALTMGRYSPEARKEFSDQLAIEFANVPHDLLCEALRAARRSVSYAEKLVPFVFEFIEPRLEKLRIEGDSLKRLERIALGGRPEGVRIEEVNA